MFGMGKIISISNSLQCGKFTTKNELFNKTNYFTKTIEQMSDENHWWSNWWESESD